MQCQSCQKNQATVHLTQIQDNRMTEVHLCQSCANDKGLTGLPVQPKISMGDILAKMVDDMSPTEEERIGPVQCPNCGMHYSLFKETGRLGCADCYTAFGSKLRPLLRRIHGSIHHVGKLPAGEGEVMTHGRQVQRLHDELQRAVEREEFERAAEIRDRIRILEQGGSQPAEPLTGGEA
jgi:protein arginine kinase activator